MSEISNELNKMNARTYVKNESENRYKKLQSQLKLEKEKVEKLVKALTSIADYQHDFDESPYRLINYYEDLAVRTLEEINL